MPVGFWRGLYIWVRSHSDDREVGHERRPFADAAGPVRTFENLDRLPGYRVFRIFILCFRDARQLKTGCVQFGCLTYRSPPAVVVPRHTDGNMAKWIVLI